jgi:hypothetical protein
MNSKHALLAVAAVAALAGFYFGNSPSGTGIYSSFIGSVAANAYSAGNKLAGNKAPSTATATS